MAGIEIRDHGALLEALQQEDPRLGDLDEKELEYVVSVLAEMNLSNDSSLLDELYHADFWMKPPTIEEFLEDDYFMGTLARRDEDLNQMGLIPEWRELLVDAFNPVREVAIRQLIYSGPIGSGKTFCGVIALLYRLAKALCMRNPLLYYGLSKATKLNFFFLSITREQVMEGAFGDCIGMMRESPFFIECCDDDLSKQEFRNQRVKFRNNILVQAGSQARHAIGRNTLASFIDEVNFRIEKDGAKAAKDMHDAIGRRTKSRFGESEDGLMILVSSAKNETDFLADHIRKSKKDPSILIAAKPFWETMGKYKIIYSGDTFLVDPGDAFTQPQILSDSTTKEELGDIVGGRVIKVPIEHRSEFLSDLPGAIKDVAGLGAATSRKFFYNHWSLISSLRDDIVDPLRGRDIIPLSIEPNMGVTSGKQVHEFMNWDGVITMRDGSRQPVRDPSAPRFLHIDISTGAQDALGITMIHPKYKSEIETINVMTHTLEKKVSPSYEVDFSFGISRDVSGEPIDFGKVRIFVLWLIRNGYNIHSVTADLLTMSQEMINILRQNGVNASYLSVDRKKDAYSILRQVYAEGRLMSAEHKKLYLELVNLEDEAKKIDHPAKNSVHWGGETLYENGSKDIADSLAGSIMNAETNKDAIHIPFISEMTEEEKGILNESDVRRSGGDDLPDDPIPTF